jgi:hypothetical protein
MPLRMVLALAVIFGAIDLAQAQRRLPTYRAPNLIAPSPKLVVPRLTLPQQQLKIYKTPRIHRAPRGINPRAVPRAILPPPPCGPECQRRRRKQKTAEEARRKFAQCMGEASRSDGKLSKRKLVNCAFGFMSPYRFSRFRRCISGKRPRAWKCFRSAYL